VIDIVGAAQTALEKSFSKSRITPSEEKKDLGKHCSCDAITFFAQRHMIVTEAQFGIDTGFGYTIFLQKNNGIHCSTGCRHS
jgi:hypothetical protein